MDEHCVVERVLVLDWFDGVVAALCVVTSGDALLLETTSDLPLSALPEYRVQRVSGSHVRQLAAAADELGERDGRRYLPVWPTEPDAASALEAVLERVMATVDSTSSGRVFVNLGSASEFTVRWFDES